MKTQRNVKTSCKAKTQSKPKFRSADKCLPIFNGTILPVDTAEEIRLARKQANMTQEGFCKLLCSVEPTAITITRRDLSKYETGKNVPPADKFLKILRVSKHVAQNTQI